MERETYFNKIEKLLSSAATRVGNRSGMGLYDTNIFSEDFYAHFLNAVYDFNLVNLNNVERNSPGIDLVDHKKRIVIQVSATATKEKIESSLEKVPAEYNGYTFKFVSISKRLPVLKEVKNPSRLLYDPEKDTLDNSKILRDIKGMDIEKMQRIHNFVCQELREREPRQKIESNLAILVNMIANEDLRLPLKIPQEIIPYDIEDKITFNRLLNVRALIDDYKVYYYKVDQIYSDFDKQGANKSLSVLNQFSSLYVK